MKFTLSTLVKRYRSGAHIDPERDWYVIATIALLIFCGLLVWNIWTFDQVAGGQTIGNTATTPAAFNRSSIDAIRTVFDARAQEENKYRTGVYQFSDPSQ